ncbi:hypothetical protein F5144DRAFT_590136 [Chaetomium tenue]|uniref:Uncharacterized protein n=1 Tax=Chaetomium tenue TaxID=1854479 RepID=A0ACB7PI12_9PEZI|nr:hypothetical protein F5144DRAFT_590136 [Chaetomium globosum]
MSSTSRSQSPGKRPRLSLQIKALANGPTMRTSRCLAATVDVKSPTSFNTLSNEKPPMAFDVAVKKPSANTPYLGPYLDTPVTAQAMSPAVARQVFFPSAMTATPPLSAQPQEQNGSRVFTFDAATPATALPPPGLNAPAPAPAMQNPRRRTTVPNNSTKLPYTHPRSLRSILRNSPLPPLSTMSPESPRRQSLRLQEKALRRVAYNSPLTQEITTSRYIKSHIDLLAEDATPISPSVASSDDGDSLLDQAMTDAASTRDGGQTPGPFEEMRRRMANMHASTPLALSPTGGGIRKRGGKRKEKKRRWVWTIGQDEDADEGGEAVDAEPVTAKKDAPASVPVLAVPAPRPRTRNQQALAKAVAAATLAQEQAQTQNQTPTQVPLLAIPVPPARAATKIPTLQPPAPIQTAPHPAPQPQSQPPPPPPPPQQQHQPLQQQQQQQQQTRELTPIPASLLPTRHSTPDSLSSAPSSCANSVRHLTPEPLGMGMGMSLGMNLNLDMGMNMGMSPGMSPPLGGMVVVEPPTPSMESTTSAGSSLHSREEGDVEMSDASSFTSVEADEGDHEEGDGEGKGMGKKGGFGLGLGLYTTSAAVQGVMAGDGDVEMDEGTPTMTARPIGERGGRGWVPWRDVVSSS